jgi:hypothetical protein
LKKHGRNVPGTEGYKVHSAQFYPMFVDCVPRAVLSEEQREFLMKMDIFSFAMVINECNIQLISDRRIFSDEEKRMDIVSLMDRLQTSAAGVTADMVTYCVANELTRIYLGFCQMETSSQDAVEYMKTIIRQVNNMMTKHRLDQLYTIKDIKCIDIYCETSALVTSDIISFPATTAPPTTSTITANTTSTTIPAPSTITTTTAMAAAAPTTATISYSLTSCRNILKTQLGIEANGVKDVIKAALENLCDDSLSEYCSNLPLIEKANRLVAYVLENVEP